MVADNEVPEPGDEGGLQNCLQAGSSCCQSGRLYQGSTSSLVAPSLRPFWGLSLSPEAKDDHGDTVRDGMLARDGTPATTDISDDGRTLAEPDKSYD